jgi:phosphopantetheinyl transferase
MRRLAADEIHVWPLPSAGVQAVLAEYLGAAVEISRSPLGKPYVAGAGIEFSVSHTDGCAVVAVSRRVVGIDVEAEAPLPDLESLARASLASGEARVMATMPPAERQRWYYRCWVRKEALLKARGRGLTVDPRSLDTTSGHGWHWHDARLAGDVAMSVATAHCGARIVVMPSLR